MSGWVTVCTRLYRRAARTFPYEFRAVCGDGLEQLGKDVIPLVWQQQGAVGMIRLFADLAMRLPDQDLSTWISKAKELTMTDDVFEGTWTAKSEDTQWDVRDNPKPQQWCVRFEATEAGYLMVMYGIVDGKAVAERPQAIEHGRTTAAPPGFQWPSDPSAFHRAPWPLAAAQIHRVWRSAPRSTEKCSARARTRYRRYGKTLTATNEGVGLKGPYKVVGFLNALFRIPSFRKVKSGLLSAWNNLEVRGIEG